jgi:HlyD family secretion protein
MPILSRLRSPGRVPVILAVVLAAGAIWFFTRGDAAARVTYETAKVERGVVERAVSSSGSVAALVTVDVGSQISGQISELHADFNTQVKKGDLLAVLDPQTYRSRVASAEAALAVGNANLGTQRANLRKAETNLQQARRDFERSQQLAEQKLIAVSAVEDSRKAMELAESDVDIARAQLANAQASIKTQQATLDQQRIDLSRTEIRSPIDGIVIKRSIDRGQTVAASLQAPILFTLAQDLSRIQIEAKVDEADIGAIKVDDTATFTVDAFPDQSFRGRVAQVRLAATTVQNVVTYSVMVQADNPRQQLLPGMTANVRIVTDRRENVLRVVNDATRYQPPGAATGGRNTAAEGPPGGGPGGGFGQNQQMMQELGLSKEQQERLETGRREMFAQLRQNQPAGGGLAGGPPGGPGGFDNNQAQAMRARFDNLMRGILTPEQMQKFEQLRSARGGPRTRRGTVWVMPEGKVRTPVAREVRLGLSDDRYTELVGDEVKEGESVVTRSRTEQKK